MLAKWIVRFCQQRGEGWEPVSLNQLTRYCCGLAGSTEASQLEPLVSGGYVVVNGDEVVLTARFVTTCCNLSPDVY